MQEFRNGSEEPALLGYNRTLVEGLTFEDILLIPQYSDIMPSQVDVQTHITENIKLNIPLLSSAMDTVTESRAAIAIAQCGGLGVIHKNMSIGSQAAQVKRVKKYESGIISDPITVTPNMVLTQALNLMNTNGVSGLPVIEQKKLVGILTSRDIRYLGENHRLVKDVMTTKLVTVKEGTSFGEARQTLYQYRIEKLPVVNDAGELVGLITLKDMEKEDHYPLAVKDSFGRLLVGAAVGIGSEAIERSEALVEMGVDILVIDTAHGHTQAVYKTTKELKAKFPEAQIVAGNIATQEAALFLSEAGVDAVKVGIGPGSICTTRIVAGCGVPQLTAIQNCVNALKGSHVKVIADGGIRYSGDIIKALAFGADTIMIGNLFAGTDEAPGEQELYQGRRYKSYRGMGSLAAMKQGSSDRYYQDNRQPSKLVPEGIEGRVPYRGMLSEVIHQLIGGLKSGMGYCGAAKLAELRAKAKFVKITQSGLNESHVHDVYVTKEAPNYRR